MSGLDGAAPERDATRAVEPPAGIGINAGLLLLVTAAELLALFGAPLLVRGEPALALGLILPAVLLTPMHWGLIHEAIHGQLLPGARLNRAAGRMLSALLGYAFDVVRFGHLMHHAAGGHIHDRPDLFPPGVPRWRASLRHYGHLLGGQYLLSVLCAVPAFLPWRLGRRMVERGMAGDGPDATRLRGAALQWFGQSRRRAATRTDAASAILLLLASAWLWGRRLPWLLLLVWGRGLMISVLDNMPHYGTCGGGHEAVLAFRSPRWLQLLVMNHHLHRTHHHRPQLPWTAVPAEFARADGRYDRGYLAGVAQQFRGPRPG